jgi:hypothetical protein
MIVFMRKQQSMQKRWSWIMGAITLVVSLFLPHLWGPWRVSGFFWQLFYPYSFWYLFHSGSLWLSIISRTSHLDLFVYFFPPCALTASTVWLWSRQMNQRPTVIRARVVVLEATVLALLATAVIFSMIFIIPYPGNGWAVAFALFDTMGAGLAFLAFLPCLLIAATVLASFQRKIRLPKTV